MTGNTQFPEKLFTTYICCQESCLQSQSKAIKPLYNIVLHPAELFTTSKYTQKSSLHHTFTTSRAIHKSHTNFSLHNYTSVVVSVALLLQLLRRMALRIVTIWSEVDWDVTTTVASVVRVDEKISDDTEEGTACSSGPATPGAWTATQQSAETCSHYTLEVGN